MHLKVFWFILFSSNNLIALDKSMRTGDFSMIERYSVGDFASKLGVTSALIKYYEKQGLLKPEIQNAGYRYYTVRGIPLILDVIKWKNMGFSAKDVVSLMQATRYEQLSDLLLSNRSAIEQQIRYLQGVLDYTDQMGISQSLYTQKSDWDIGYYGDFYFLPTHTNQELLGNEATSRLMHEWLRWLPVVQPTAKADMRRDEADEILWGLSVPKSFADAQSLPMDDIVEFIPKQRSLRVLDRRPLPHQEDDMPEEQIMRNQMFINIRRITENHNFNIVGPSYFTIQSKVREGEYRYSYQRIITPIE